MRYRKKDLVLSLGILCLILICATLLVALLDKDWESVTLDPGIYVVTHSPTPKPDPYNPVEIEREAKGFVESVSTEQDYSLVAINQTLDSLPVSFQGWVLLTIARAPEGVIALGRLEEGGWQFKLLGDKGFENWLDQIPDKLLPSDLKDYFRLEITVPSVSKNAPGQVITGFPLQLPAPLLPWPAGKTYILSNGPGGGYHIGENHYAQDWGIPTGQEISAVLPGKVVEVVRGWGTGTCDIRLANQANLVRVELETGETVLYLHLSEVLVEQGQTVEQGQIIAKSGASGFTCNHPGTGPKPHLHIVWECVNKKCSRSLDFVEFGGNPPRVKSKYTSQNELPEVRRTREQEERKAEVLTSLENFYKAYRCSRLNNCEESAVTNELKFVTEELQQKLFPKGFCFGCPAKIDNLEEVAGTTKYVSFPDPTGESVRIRVLSVAKVTDDGTVEYHYTATNVDLVKEKDRWKVNDWESTCGYISDENHKVIQKINLEGCEWKLETSQSGSSP